MDPAKAKALLKAQIKKSYIVQDKPRFGSEWQAWNRKTAVLIEKVFSKDSRNLKDFTDIQYQVAVWSSAMPESKDIEAYNEGLDTARRYLASMIEELDLYADSEVTDTNIKVRLRDLFSRFHRLGRQLRVRRENRPTLAIDDEYDVQDLLHALLHLYSDDIRPEEWNTILRRCVFSNGFPVEEGENCC